MAITTTRTDRMAALSRSEEGAVATWFAILLVPLLGFVFAAIKFTDYAEHRSEMLDAMDAAGLGISRYADAQGFEPCAVAESIDDGKKNSSDDKARAKLERYGRELFAENFPEAMSLYSDKAVSNAFDIDTDLVFTFSCEKVMITAAAFKPMGRALGSFFGVESLPMNVRSEVSLPGEGRVEIALVLDYSGSMKGAKIGGLKNAVRGMLDELYGTPTNSVDPNIKLGIVPFTSTVNIAPEEFYWTKSGTRTPEAKWIDTQARSLWHGANFFHAERKSGASEAEKLTFGGRKVNHFDLFETVGSERDWAGCVEARPFPLDEIPHPPNVSFSVGDYNAALTKPSGLKLPSDQPSEVKTLSLEAWSKLKDPANETLDFDPSAPGRVAGTTYRSLVTGTSASTRFVPWFYPDEADCWDDDYDDGDACAIAAAPSWLSAYLGAPTAKDALLIDTSNDARNRRFIPDLDYVTPDVGDKDEVRPYLFTLLDYRNTVGRNFGPTGNPGIDTDCYDPVSGFYPSGVTEDPDMARVARWFRAFPCADGETAIRSAYVGYWDDATDTYEGKYDLYDHGDLGGSIKDFGREGPNIRCWQPLVPMTSDKKTLWTFINGSQAGSGTNSAAGLIWGYRLLTPGAPYPGAADWNTAAGRKWKKVVVLMSDGRNNVVRRDHHLKSDMLPWGYTAQDRLFLADDDATAAELDAIYEDEMDRKSVRICHRMRAEGIKIYSVGYDIKADSDAWAMLRACAVEPDSAYLAKDAKELERVFEKITSSIVDLHVSR